MKAATGELNLTVITVVAIVAVMGIFYLLFPKIQEMINNQWDALGNRDESIKGTQNAGGTTNYIVIDGYDVTIR